MSATCARRVLGALAAALALTALPSLAGAQAGMAYASAARYDGLGRVTGTIAPDPDGAGSLPLIATRNTYDGAGRLIRVETGTLSVWQSETSAPAAWAGFTILRTVDTVYDSSGRTLHDRLSGSDGIVRTVTQYSYDLDGRLECSAVRMNPALFGSLPSSACTQATPVGSDGQDRITRNVYDLAGQRLQLREGVETSAEAAEATWAYSLNGQVTAVIDANGNRAEMRYDGHDRRSCWLFPSPVRPPSYADATPEAALQSAGSANGNCADLGDYERYSYDPNGNRTSLRKRDGSTLTYQYDALNRLSVKTIPDRLGLDSAHERDVFYAYDLRGLQTAARFDSPSGEGVASAWDGFGRLTSTTIDMGGTARSLSYRYDRNGNRTRLTFPDAAAMDYSYDRMDRMVAIAEAGGSWTHILFYDVFGRGAALIRANGPTTGYGYHPVFGLQTLQHDMTGTATDAEFQYGYNPARQVASQTRNNDSYAWTGHYAVDRPYVTNGLNQYDTVGNAQLDYDYDANGNLVSDGSRTWLYDVENRLVGGPGGLVVTYDPLGRLFQTGGGAHPTTRYLYDGDALVAEYDAAGAMTRRHAHWAGADVPMVSYAGAGLSQRAFLHADHQGSIIASSNASGHATVNAYDEYGIPAAANAGRFQYTGQAWLPELGMYHYKARIYSPTLGRFMQTDPVGYDDQFNLYGYVGNDPVNHADPDGQQALPLLGLCVGPQAPACGVVVLGGSAVAGCAASSGCRGFVGRVFGGLFPGVRGSPTVATSDSGSPRRRAVPAPATARGSNAVTVYRLYGGQSGPNGRSWTTADPRAMANPRDRLGLPNGNTARYLDIGRLVDPRGVEYQPATRLGENSQGPNHGGGPEVIIPDPAHQVPERRTESFRDPSPPPRRRDDF